MNEIELREQKQVQELNEIGRTYFYGGVEVVPSQAYAHFSGKSAKVVNQALKRIADTGRLALSHDFFNLTQDQTQQFLR